MVSTLSRVAQQCAQGKGRKQKMATTVVSRFSSQLNDLMKELEQTSTNYVRCIKPTPKQTSGIFDASYVLDQLRNSGTNEALELMHKGAVRDSLILQESDLPANLWPTFLTTR